MPEISKLQALSTPDTSDLLLIVDINGGNGGKPRSKKITVENLFSNFEVTTGDDGLSAYQIALNNGFIGTELEWLESLNGEDGINGIDGNNGLSAYQIAVNNGFVGNESDWLVSLQGEDGIDANVMPGDWQIPTMQNTWQSVDNSVRYRLLADGRLEIRGRVARGTYPIFPTTLFTLPVGYRPLTLDFISQSVATNGGRGVAFLRVDVDGSVAFTSFGTNITGATSISVATINSIVSLDA